MAVEWGPGQLTTASRTRPLFAGNKKLMEQSIFLWCYIHMYFFFFLGGIGSLFCVVPSLKNVSMQDDLRTEISGCLPQFSVCVLLWFV